MAASPHAVGRSEQRLDSAAHDVIALTTAQAVLQAVDSSCL